LLCTVKKTSDDIQRNWSKYVEFHSKNKFEKLVHIVGFIIRKLQCSFLWWGGLVMDLFLMLLKLYLLRYYLYTLLILLLQKYHVRIHDLDQPMLVSLSKARERRSGENELVFLVPELCRMTGLTDDMRANFTLMRDLGEHTRINPPVRLKRLENFNQRLQREGAVSCVVVGQWWRSATSNHLCILINSFFQKPFMCGLPALPQLFMFPALKECYAYVW